jgi:hypothetical protein
MRSRQEIAYRYWLLAARVVKDERFGISKADRPPTSAASINAWPA